MEQKVHVDFFPINPYYFGAVIRYGKGSLSFTVKYPNSLDEQEFLYDNQYVRDISGLIEDFTSFANCPSLSEVGHIFGNHMLVPWVEIPIFSVNRRTQEEFQEKVVLQNSVLVEFLSYDRQNQIKVSKFGSEWVYQTKQYTLQYHTREGVKMEFLHCPFCEETVPQIIKNSEKMVEETGCALKKKLLFQNGCTSFSNSL